MFLSTLMQSVFFRFSIYISLPSFSETVIKSISVVRLMATWTIEEAIYPYPELDAELWMTIVTFT